jgi:hypothetical protein
MIKFKVFRNTTSPTFNFLLLVAIGFCLLLSGCSTNSATKEPQFADRSFITDNPCASPCWYGLVPGVSTESEVEAELAELPFVDQEAIRKNYDVSIRAISHGASIQFGCAEPKGKSCGFIVLSDDIVQIIDMVIQYQLSIQTVIDKLGEPDYVYFTSYTSHGDGCLMDLDWLARGISVRLVDQSSTRLCHELRDETPLDPNLAVNEVVYLSEKAIIPDRCEGSSCIPWPGFRAK